MKRIKAIMTIKVNRVFLRSFPASTFGERTIQYVMPIMTTHTAPMMIDKIFPSLNRGASSLRPILAKAHHS
jgi:hypothetical protein